MAELEIVLEDATRKLAAARKRLAAGRLAEVAGKVGRWLRQPLWPGLVAPAWRK